MRKNIFKKNLVEFMKNSNCSFTCVYEIKKILKMNGFKELSENSTWNKLDNKFFVIRNDASIIAFIVPSKKVNSFSIVTTHSDVPSLLLKPNGANLKEKYLRYNVMPYGGILNYGFLDRVFSLSGRIIIRKKNVLIKKIVDLKKPLMIVPSVAIHLNDKANINLDLNAQVDLQPLISIAKDKNAWIKILEKEVSGEIVDYELFTYSLENPTFIGLKEELLVSPRIDNLTSVYSGLISFLESESNNIKVFTAFNNEEIGSLTLEGADSNFLLDSLKRVAVLYNLDIASCLANSFIVSSDNTHAIHPNHTELSDETGALCLGDGFAIIKEETSTTNSISSAIIKSICQKNKIKFQDSTLKNDVTDGSTLSGISLRHVSILSIDVGIPELAMHSSVETCAINDIYELYRMMKCFFKTKIKFNNKNIDIR